jgi:MFS family permease
VADADSADARGSGSQGVGPAGGVSAGPWLLVVLFTVPLIGYVHRLIINILIDPISAELAISDTQASFLQGPPFAVAYALMVIPMGLLADRGNRLLLLGCGAVIWSIGTLMCGLAADFTWLFLARLVVGIGEAALTPAVVSFIGDSFAGDRRGFAMGVFFTGINAGFSSAYAIGGITLEAGAGRCFRRPARARRPRPVAPGVRRTVPAGIFHSPADADPARTAAHRQRGQRRFLADPVAAVFALPVFLRVAAGYRAHRPVGDCR